MAEITAQMTVRADTFDNWLSSNPTPALGEWVLDSTHGALRMGDGVTPWVLLPIVSHDIRRSFSVANDLLASVTPFGNDWVVSVSGSGADVTPASELEEMPGVQRLSTGTTSTGLALALYKEAVIPPAAPFIVSWRTNLDVRSVTANQYQSFVGVSTAALTEYAVFTHRGDVSSDFDFEVIRAGGSTETIPTGVTVLATGDPWRTCTIARNTAGTAIYGYLDGVLVATATTALALPDSVVTPAVVMVKSVGNTERKMNVDWCTAFIGIDRVDGG